MRHNPFAFNDLDLRACSPQPGLPGSWYLSHAFVRTRCAFRAAACPRRDRVYREQEVDVRPTSTGTGLDKFVVRRQSLRSGAGPARGQPLVRAAKGGIPGCIGKHRARGRTTPSGPGFRRPVPAESLLTPAGTGGFSQGDGTPQIPSPTSDLRSASGLPVLARPCPVAEDRLHGNPVLCLTQIGLDQAREGLPSSSTSLWTTRT
jgi:hypothetical protein